MAGREGFSRTLKEQRMSFKHFVDLNSEHFRVRTQANASKIYAAPLTDAAHTKQRADGTLMQFQRLKPIRE